MTYIAPAGTPLSLADIAIGIGAGAWNRHAAQTLCSLLSRHSGRQQSWLMTSGRAGMTLIFEAMKRAANDPKRLEIIVPGYTCYSVPAAAQRAGLRVRLCDVDPKTLSMNLTQLRACDFSAVLGIVTANLFGIPNELPEIEAVARANGVYLLDDAAQALGAQRDNRPVGGFGDVGLYSFDKGKIVTTIQGGAIVARDGRLSDAIGSIFGTTPAASGAETLGYIAKLCIYGVMLRPRFYGVTQRLPFLGLGRTPYETMYPLKRYSPTLAGLALRLAMRLDQINSVRIANAERLKATLKNVPGVSLVEFPSGAKPVFARFPILVSPEKRHLFIDRLTAAGIGATRSYPNALIDVPELASHLSHNTGPQLGARQVAQSIVTLPTHSYCPPNLAERVRAIALDALR